MNFVKLEYGFQFLHSSLYASVKSPWFPIFQRNPPQKKTQANFLEIAVYRAFQALLRATIAGKYYPAFLAT